jgi:NADH-quinone oxidoreductase subunit N
MDFNLIGKYHPILGVYLTIIFFSMAGIPPLSGFFGKYYILLSGVEANSLILVIFSLFLNILSTFYYIRLIKLIWFGSKPITQQIPYYFDKNWIFLIISSFCVIWILSFIIFLPTIIDFSIFLISNAIIC